jgi:hypothetical protein
METSTVTSAPIMELLVWVSILNHYIVLYTFALCSSSPGVPTGGHTTGISYFVVCLKHTAKTILHSAKALPSVTLGKERSANCTSAAVSLPSTFCRALGKEFVECR